MGETRSGPMQLTRLYWHGTPFSRLIALGLPLTDAIRYADSQAGGVHILNNANAGIG